MELDFSKLLPALFNDKDICLCDWMEQFFDEFDGTYCCNSHGTTFVGFIQDHEVRIHSVVNRMEISFINGKPSEELVEKVKNFINIDVDDGVFVNSLWKEGNTINIQYYYNPNV